MDEVGKFWYLFLRSLWCMWGYIECVTLAILIWIFEYGLQSVLSGNLNMPIIPDYAFHLLYLPIIPDFAFHLGTRLNLWKNIWIYGLQSVLSGNLLLLICFCCICLLFLTMNSICCICLLFLTLHFIWAHVWIFGPLMLQATSWLRFSIQTLQPMVRSASTHSKRIGTQALDCDMSSLWVQFGIFVYLK